MWADPKIYIFFFQISFYVLVIYDWGFPDGLVVKNLVVKNSYFSVQETWVWSLIWEDPLEKEMATHSWIFAWEILWTEEAVDFSPWGCKILRNDLATKQQQYI